MFYRELQIDNVPGEMNRRNESRHATLHLKKSCQQRSLAASRWTTTYDHWSRAISNASATFFATKNGEPSDFTYRKCFQATVAFFLSQFNLRSCFYHSSPTFKGWYGRARQQRSLPWRIANHPISHIAIVFKQVRGDCVALINLYTRETKKMIRSKIAYSVHYFLSASTTLY